MGRNPFVLQSSPRESPHHTPCQIWKAGPTTTSVNLEDGAAILADAVAIESSVVNTNGGAVADFVRASDNSVLNFSGGDVGFFLGLREDATMTVSGE